MADEAATKELPQVRCYLKEIREAKGLVQQQMTVLCGVSRQTQIIIEKYGWNPTYNTKRKLAKALGVKVRDIWPDEDEE